MKKDNENQNIDITLKWESLQELAKYRNVVPNIEHIEGMVVDIANGGVEEFGFRWVPDPHNPGKFVFDITDEKRYKEWKDKEIPSKKSETSSEI